MKKRINTNSLRIIVIAFALIVSAVAGCNYQYTDGPNFPSAVRPNSSFTADFEALITDGCDNHYDLGSNPYQTYAINIGIKIPESFITGGVTSSAISDFDVIVQPQTGSPVSSDVTFDTSVVTSLNTLLPPESGYVWWGGTTGNIPVRTNSTVNGIITFESSGINEANYNVEVAVFYNDFMTPVIISSGGTYAIFVESTPPQIEITSHTEEQILPSQNITLSGTVSDNFAVDSVQVRVNDGGLENAVIDSGNWFKSIDLIEGLNTIEALAFDEAGSQASAEIHLISYPDAAISVNPGDFAFNTEENGICSNQTLSLTNIGGSPLFWSVTEDADWLTLDSTNGQDNVDINLSVDATGLAPGTYNTDITITSNAFNEPQVILPVTLTINELTAPIITGVLPNSAYIENEITINGDNFDSGTTVKFGEIEAGNVEFVSPTELIATVPLGLTPGATYDITVTNSGAETYTLSDAFTLLGAAVSVIALPPGETRNHPNPFDPTKEDTNIIFNVNATETTVKIYDLKGKAIWTKRAYPLSGTYFEVPWNGKSDFGEYASNGSYIYLITSNGKVLAKGQLAVWR